MTSDWFICIQATSPLQIGGGGAGISNSQNSTFLATTRASNEKCVRKKLTCHTHQIHSLLPATMKSITAVFNDIHNANDHRAPEPRVYLFFPLSQDRIESSASMSFLRSAHAVNDAWVLSTSLLVSRC